jgi:hypothetical protein
MNCLLCKGSHSASKCPELHEDTQTGFYMKANHSHGSTEEEDETLYMSYDDLLLLCVLLP